MPAFLLILLYGRWGTSKPMTWSVAAIFLTDFRILHLMLLIVYLSHRILILHSNGLVKHKQCGSKCLVGDVNKILLVDKITMIGNGWTSLICSNVHILLLIIFETQLRTFPDQKLRNSYSCLSSTKHDNLSLLKAKVRKHLLSSNLTTIQHQ